jgi:hypothetical protein
MDNSISIPNQNWVEEGGFGLTADSQRPLPRLTNNTPIGLWSGAQIAGDTGIRAEQGSIALTLFEIPSIPNLSSPRFTDYSKMDKSARIGQMGDRINRFLVSLSDLGEGFSVSLRFFYQPQPGGVGRIRLFIVGRGFGKDSNQATKVSGEFSDLVSRSFPDEYKRIALPDTPENHQIYEKVVDLRGVQSIAELLKPEQILPTWHDPELLGFSRYYSPKFFEAAGNDMVEFCRSLSRESMGREVMVDICLVPTPPLTEQERLELNRWKSLTEQLSRGFEREIPGGLYSKTQKIKFDPDPHAREIQREYEKLMERYGNPQNRYFLYGIRALWWDPQPPREIVNALSTFALAPQNSPFIVPIDTHSPEFPKALNAIRGCYISPAVCRKEIWGSEERLETIRRLHRMADLKEISGFFRLPIAGHDGCPGMPLDTGFDSQNAGTVSSKTTDGVKEHKLVIGEFTDKTGEFSVPLNGLTRHGLIVGMPGSGKTTLCLSMLHQLWNDEVKIPFIVLEPAKTEYRGLRALPEFKDDLLVFTVGKESVSPFRFNPFEVPPGIELSEHLSTLTTCFAGAFNLWDPLPMMFDQAMRDIYEQRGWSEMMVGGEDQSLLIPTLEDMYRRCLEIAETSSYKGEVAGNIKGAIETRLGSLIRGVKGRCFNTRLSIPFRVLMSRPVILELDALNDDEKALVMMFILSLVRSFAKTESRARKGKLSHLVLVEEAHNVIPRDGGRGDGSGGNPKEVAVRFFVNMLAELRAWGEGILIADQLPTAIASEAIKNTDLKVMHRIVAADDRQELGNTMVIDGGQFEQAATLPNGFSLVFRSGHPRSKMVQEPNIKADWEEAGYVVEPPPSDGEIKDQMDEFRAREDVRDAYLPYKECRLVCRACNPRLRERIEVFARKQIPVIKEKYLEESRVKEVDIRVHALEQFIEQASTDDVSEGCATIHYVEVLARELLRKR